MIWEDACHALGVSETATPADIKEQYLYKMQLLHPDKTIDKPEKVRQKAEEELVGINEAYNFLSEDKNNPRNPPILEIVPRIIRFVNVGLNQRKDTTIEINNTGGPFTNCWIDNSPAPWLSVTSIKATSSDAMPLLVTIEGFGQPSIVKTERCQVIVRLKNEKTGLLSESAIAVEISPIPLAANLKVKGHKIKSRNLPIDTVQSFVLEIGNRGPDTLHGYFASNTPWLSVSQSELVLTKRTMTRCLINVDTTNLPVGFRDSGLVNICTNGGEAVIPVELTTARQRKSRSASISPYPSSQVQGHKTHGAMHATTSAPRVRKKGSATWFLIFILALLLIFGLSLIAILLLLGYRPDDFYMGNF